MRAVRVALIVSVALNLLVAGVFLGAWLDGGPHRDARPRGAGPMAPFAAAMAPEDRAVLLSELREGSRSERSQHFRARFHDLLETIQAEPFDRARVEGLLAEQRTAAVERQATAERLLVDQIAAMSAAKRTAYAERLEAAFSGPRRR